ncbi:Atu4866 domain-containing protein [Actinoplanes sp. NPDC051494]|uniref:Atu4866 domain-containing protein n=1 Tax=Actinoplanes sp. NPDC051494 TaxID=3363907 RepID=UPI003796B96E
MKSFDRPVTIVPTAPGDLSSFVVLEGARPGPLESMIWWPRDVAFQYGEPVPGPSDSPHLGVWTDERTGVIQELTPDGRYDETRNGRRHAYQGNFWIAGDHIVYHDDLDFWAYGTFVAGTLEHADFRFRRA